MIQGAKINEPGEDLQRQREIESAFHALSNGQFIALLGSLLETGDDQFSIQIANRELMRRLFEYSSVEKVAV